MLSQARNVLASSLAQTIEEMQAWAGLAHGALAQAHDVLASSLALNNMRTLGCRREKHTVCLRNHTVSLCKHTVFLRFRLWHNILRHLRSGNTQGVLALAHCVLAQVHSVFAAFLA